MTLLPHFKSELTGEELLPEHLLKGKRAYEQWASVGGTITDFFPYDSLGDLDRQRWVFFAKAYGDPAHDHSFAVKPPKDVQNYPELAHVGTIDLFDYDKVQEELGYDSTGRKLSGIDHSVIPRQWPNYTEWVAQHQSTPSTKRWWQFWRSSSSVVDVSQGAYAGWLQNQRAEQDKPTMSPVADL